MRTMLGRLKEKLREMDDKGEISPRSPIKAFLFSMLCPGLGQQYAGDLARGVSLYTALIVVSWLSAILFMLIGSRISILLFAVPVVGFFFIAFDAYLCASIQPRDYKMRWYNRKGIYMGVFLLLLVTVNPLMDLVVGKTVVRAYIVHGTSMVPTLIDHDLLLANKLAYKTSNPKRGDVVLILFGKGRRSGVTRVIDDELIRRIIAVPGDTVEMRGNEVIINGEKLNEPYALYESSLVYSGGGENTLVAQKVPENSYFVLGDNRNHSLDSRVFGFIDRDRLGGKITKVFWSWNLEEKKIKWERTGISVR